jgi:hypothetical protein
MMEASTSETSIHFYQTTWRNKPSAYTPCENLKPAAPSSQRLAHLTFLKCRTTQIKSAPLTDQKNEAIKIRLHRNYGKMWPTNSVLYITIINYIRNEYKVLCILLDFFWCLYEVQPISLVLPQILSQNTFFFTYEIQFKLWKSECL